MKKSKLSTLVSSETENPIEKPDWKELEKQKLTLVTLTFYPKKYNLTQKQADHIDGIVNYLDAIQDYAVDILGIGKNIVFPSLSKKK